MRVMLASSSGPRTPDSGEQLCRTPRSRNRRALPSLPLSMNQGGCAALRRGSARAALGLVAPLARARRAVSKVADWSTGSSPLPDCPASTGTRRGRCRVATRWPNGHPRLNPPDSRQVQRLWGFTRSAQRSSGLLTHLGDPFKNPSGYDVRLLRLCGQSRSRQSLTDHRVRNQHTLESFMPARYVRRQ